VFYGSYTDFLYPTPFFVKSDEVPGTLQRTDRPVYELVSWDGVRLSPLGTWATNWPIVPAPDDR
jgi:hypothetical protein